MLFESSQHREALQLSSSPPSIKFMAIAIQSQMRKKIVPESKLSDEPWWKRCFKRTAVTIITLSQLKKLINNLAHPYVGTQLDLTSMAGIDTRYSQHLLKKRTAVALHAVGQLKKRPQCM
jgi:hypothetical protein